MSGLTGRGGATSEEFGRDPQQLLQQPLGEYFNFLLWKMRKWPSATSWWSLFCSHLSRLLHGWIDGCLCSCGWHRRSSRSSSSCAGVSTVHGHDTEIPCLSSLLHLLGSRTRDHSLLGFCVFITHAFVCDQPGKKVHLNQGIIPIFSPQKLGLRFGPEKKAEFTKCKETTVVGGKYLYGNSSLCQAYRKEAKDASYCCLFLWISSSDGTESDPVEKQMQTNVIVLYTTTFTATVRAPSQCSNYVK